MGKIKSKQIKRYSEEMIQKGVEFSENFDRNKKGNWLGSRKCSLNNFMANSYFRDCASVFIPFQLLADFPSVSISGFFPSGSFKIFLSSKGILLR